MYASVAASTLKLGEGCASGGTVVTEGISLAALLPADGGGCAETMPKPRQNIRKTRRNKAQAARMPEIIKEVTSLENRLEYIRARAADSFKRRLSNWAVRAFTWIIQVQRRTVRANSHSGIALALFGSKSAAGNPCAVQRVS